ncbi:UbiA family prenyltransferase [Candidatus Nomurabacteria bacterium]|nr:UbiA family prenyltransferase [Candidatus Nomurabacteria bacterium]
MEKLRLLAQSVPITFTSWIISFTGIVFIRTLFEQFPSYQPGHFALIDAPTIIHYGVSYLAILVTLMVILVFFARTSLREIFAISIFGFLIILLPPIIDIIWGGIGGQLISYFFATGKELSSQFITFFGWNISSGITLGIQIEIILVMIACYVYVYAVTKNILRSILASIAFYCLIFFIFSIPSILALFLTPQNEPFNAVTKSIFSSHIIQNNIHPNFTATSMGLFDLGFNKIMSGISIIIVMFSSTVLFFLGAQKKFLAVVKNSRPERILHYVLLFIFGSTLTQVDWFTNWVNIQTYFLALISFVFAWMFSVCQNDIQDEEIDAISNTNRPLVLKELSKSDMETASKIFLFFALLSAYSSSHYVLFFVSLFIFIYYIYSNPPLRLKRFTIFSSFLISLACLSAVMSGFFLLSPDKSILAFPLKIILAIVVLFTVVSNIRDIKDVEGDRALRIKTLPVLLGLEKAKKIIAGTIFFFFLITPWYLEIPFFMVPSVLVAILSWYFINKEDYKEWKFFVVYLIYFILLIGAIILK